MEYVIYCSFLHAVGIGNFPHAHVKLTRPNIVGMKPLPYNIRKGELKIATLQNPSSHVRHAAALVSYYYSFIWHLLCVVCSIDAIS